MKKPARKRKYYSNASEFMKSIGMPIIIGVLSLLIMITIRFQLFNRFNHKPRSKLNVEYPVRDELKDVLNNLFTSNGLSFRFNKSSKSSAEFWKVFVPKNIPIPSLHLMIKDSINPIGAKIISARSRPLESSVLLEIGYQDSVMIRLNLSYLDQNKNEGGLIAIIIDDFGDRWNSFVESFLDLKADITVSIIPGRSKSSTVARKLKNKNCEIMVHLPMEPLDPTIKIDDFTICTNMTTAQIRNIIKRSLRQIPGASGINNHMGSKVTAHRATMERLMQEIKSTGLYFVDSRTTPRTVAYRVARSMGVPCAKRDIFLDVENDKESIRKMLQELALRARKNGFAIGIGHLRKNTLEVFREEIPRLQAKGYQFVRVSRLVN